MARAKQKTAKSGGSDSDAIALLKADHRQVEEWFEEFEKAEDDAEREMLATQICDALTVHTQIEEEIFYPAFVEATGDEELYQEAQVEHDGAKKLIAEIEMATPDDEDYKAKVKVLSEMIEHHVKEEEQPGGMFAEARKSEMDLEALGQQLAQRKAELEGQSEDDSDDDTPPSRGERKERGVGRQMKGTR
jgi:hemerythrin superfamily protein